MQTCELGLVILRQEIDGENVRNEVSTLVHLGSGLGEEEEVN